MNCRTNPDGFALIWRDGVFLFFPCLLRTLYDGRNKFENLCPIPLKKDSIKYVQTKPNSICISIFFSQLLITDVINQVENEVIWGEARSIDSRWGMGFVLAIISFIDTAGNQWI